MNSNMKTYAPTLHALADEVLALVDGLGGDRREHARAETIAATLRRIAEGRSIDAVPAHTAARKTWAGRLPRQATW
jgi:hypothetical protein